MKRSILLVGLLYLLSNVPAAFGAGIPDGFYPHTIQEGDTFGKIAPKWAWKIMRLINRVDDKSLQPGQTLWIPVDPSVTFPCPVPSKITEDRAEPRSIHVFIGIQYFGAYEYGKLVYWGPISSGSGKKGRTTPLGQYRITRKDRWHRSSNPESRGAKMYWGLKLGKTNVWLHEQAMPGKEASHGCIRELTDDAMKNFAQMKVGDLVVIEK